MKHSVLVGFLIGCFIGTCLAQELIVQLGHTTSVEYLEISADGKRILSGTQDGYVKLWDLNLGRLIHTFRKNVRSEEQAEAYFKEILRQERIAAIPEFKPYSDNVGVRFIIHYGEAGAQAELSDNQTKKKKKFHVPPSALTGEPIQDKCFQVSGDNKLLALGYGSINVFITSEKSDTTIKIVDLESGTLLRALPGHRGRVNKVRFSPNGTLLVSAGFDRSIKIWDLKTGSLLRTLGSFSDALLDVTFSADGKSFATASDLPRLWEMSTGRLIQSFPGHKDLVSSVVFATDSQLISSSFDKTLKKWSTTTGVMEKNFRGHTNRITNLSISATGKYVASITSSGPELDRVSFNMSSFDKKHTAKIWDVSTGRSLKTLQGRSSITISPDEQYIACPAGGFDEKEGLENTSGFKISLFTMPQGDLLTEWKSGGSPAVVAFSPDSKLIAEGNNGLRLWQLSGSGVELFKEVNPSSGDTQLQVDASGRWVTALTFDKTGRRIAAAFNEVITLFDVKTGSALQTLSGHFDDVKAIDFSPDGKFLLSGSVDTQMKIWNLETGKEVASLIMVRNSQEFVLYTPDGYYMASKGGTQALHFVKGKRVYLFDQFDLQYNRPDIVLQRIGLASPGLIDSYKKAFEKRLKKLGFNPENFEKQKSFNAPELILNLQNNVATVNSSSFDLSLEAIDSLFNLDRLNVYVNGVPVHGMKGLDLKSRNTQSIKENIKITLSQGQNIVEVSVLNEKGVESLKERLEVNHLSSGYKPALHLVIISVSEYANAAMNLKYAAKDGKDVMGMFKTEFGQEGLFSRVVSHALLNRDATKENILKLKFELEKANVDDVVLIFVSGHGLLDGNLDYYLATHNIDFANPAQNGLKYDDLESLLDGIPARKKVLMMDACHSGEIDKEEVEMTTVKAPTAGLKFRNVGDKTIQHKNLGLRNSFELSKLLFTDLRKGSGATVLSAAGGVEFALEGDKWQNGVFTYCLLSGLKDRKADQNQDGQIMLSELQSFLFREVAAVTQGKQQPTSRIENLVVDWRIW